MLGWLYPRNCSACGVSAPEPLSHFCWECLSASLKIEPPFCARCGDPVSGMIEHDYICFFCKKTEPAFLRARSAFRYEGAVAEALRALKYRGALHVVPDLAELLAACVRAEYFEAAFDVVAAVPLHPARLRARGSNQSALLARALARRLGIPYAARLTRRTRPTPTQTGLTAPERADNVRNAFKTGSARRLKGKHVLLVDDVMTTGATVNACAHALKRGGAVSVSAVTVARG